jgi:hypothetical protein
MGDSNDAVYKMSNSALFFPRPGHHANGQDGAESQAI